VKGAYEYFLDRNYDMGFYSSFIRYIKSKKLKPTKKGRYGFCSTYLPYNLCILNLLSISID